MKGPAMMALSLRPSQWRAGDIFNDERFVGIEYVTGGVRVYLVNDDGVTHPIRLSGRRKYEIRREAA